MSGIRSSLRAALAACLLAMGAPAAHAEMSALARVHADHTELSAGWRGISMTLALSQPVPYKVMTLDNPPRLVMDSGR